MTRTTPIDRLRVLVEAGIALSSELSLDALLQQFVETAAELTGARYAALGVVDQTGTRLERFVTTGIDAETFDAIGELPRGRGILGVLIREAKPLRLENLRDDPRSVGFPPNHPPMQSFLGGRCYMNFGVPRTEALKVLGKGEDASLYMVLLAALHALLYRQTGHRLKMGLEA